MRHVLTLNLSWHCDPVVPKPVPEPRVTCYSYRNGSALGAIHATDYWLAFGFAQVRLSDTNGDRLAGRTVRSRRSIGRTDTHGVFVSEPTRPGLLGQCKLQFDNATCNNWLTPNWLAAVHKARPLGLGSWGIGNHTAGGARGGSVAL